MPEYSLMAHQKKGVEFLESVDGIGALLWEPGVGKTGATAAWIDRQADKHKEFRVLVVAPLTATDTWIYSTAPFMDSPMKARLLTGSTLSILSKIEKSRYWTGVPNSAMMHNHPGARAKQVSGNRVTILSVSAGAFSSYCRNDPRRQDRNGKWIGTGETTHQRRVRVIRAVRKYAPHLIVVDESQIIKSANGNLSVMMYQLGQLAPHRIILTGTVAPHSPLDVYGQWRFLAPWTFSNQYTEPYVKTPLEMTDSQKKEIKPWPWGRFRERYAKMGGYEGKEIKGLNPAFKDDLHARTAERSMVVEKKDALDLPPVRDVEVHVTLSPREAKAYAQMKKDLLAEIESGKLVEAPNALAKYMKLRQITGGFAKNTDTGEVHILGSSKRKAIAEVANVTLGGEKRLVVFGYFTSECHLMAELLRKMEPKTTVEVITGATKAKDRLAIRRRFGDVSQNPGRMILVAQQRTMSISVNELVTAQNAIYGCFSERREDLVQSRGRLDRNGQVGKHVTFWNVIVPDSVDEVMLKNHHERGDLEKAMLDHIRGTR